MGKSKNIIEKNKTEKWKTEIYLTKLRGNNELRCDNKIRNGDAFSEPAPLPDNV
jgi:hypothetical protein